MDKKIRIKKKFIIIAVVLVLVATLSIVGGIHISNRIEKEESNPFIGTWNSEDKTISMDFSDNGTAKITYNNALLPALGTKYNGTVNAVYAYDGEKQEMSVTITVYTKEITSHYTYEIEGRELILTDTSAKKSQTFIAEHQVED